MKATCSTPDCGTQAAVQWDGEAYCSQCFRNGITGDAEEED